MDFCYFGNKRHFSFLFACLSLFFFLSCSEEFKEAEFISKEEWEARNSSAATSSSSSEPSSSSSETAGSSSSEPSSSSSETPSSSSVREINGYYILKYNDTNDDLTIRTFYEDDKKVPFNSDIYSVSADDGILKILLNSYKGILKPNIGIIDLNIKQCIGGLSYWYKGAEHTFTLYGSGGNSKEISTSKAETWTNEIMLISYSDLNYYYNGLCTISWNLDSKLPGDSLMVTNVVCLTPGVGQIIDEAPPESITMD